MKHPVRHGGKISCDVRGCTAIFVTYSMATLVRRQAIEAGWKQLPYVMYPEAQRKKVDACPEHVADLVDQHAFEVIAKRICAWEGKLATRLTAVCQRSAQRSATVAAKHAKLVKRIARVCRAIMRDARRSVRHELAAVELNAPVGDVAVPHTPRKTSKRGGGALTVVIEVLREAASPLSVQEIIDRAGARLPSKSKTPRTVVARDLAMEIKLKGEAAAVVRTAPGRFTLRTHDAQEV